MKAIKTAFLSIAAATALMMDPYVTTLEQADYVTID